MHLHVAGEAGFGRVLARVRGRRRRAERREASDREGDGDHGDRDEGDDDPADRGTRDRGVVAHQALPGPSMAPEHAAFGSGAFWLRQYSVKNSVMRGSFGSSSVSWWFHALTAMGVSMSG